MRTAGRHFLLIPGPSPVPDRVLRAIDMLNDAELDNVFPRHKRHGASTRLAVEA